MPKDRRITRANRRFWQRNGDLKQNPYNLGMASPMAEFKTNAFEVESLFSNAIETKRRKH